LRSSARLLIDLIDWGYPEERRSYQPTIEDLSDPDTAMRYILAFGNGIINELRAEGETAEALQAIRGLALGTGACTPVELSADERQRLWFYAEGDECYRQGSINPAYVFLNPAPQPHKFAPAPSRTSES
jgi:hypothetical protein